MPIMHINFMAQTQKVSSYNTKIIHIEKYT